MQVCCSLLCSLNQPWDNCFFIISEYTFTLQTESTELISDFYFFSTGLCVYLRDCNNFFYFKKKKWKDEDIEAAVLRTLNFSGYFFLGDSSFELKSPWSWSNRTFLTFFLRFGLRVRIVNGVLERVSKHALEWHLAKAVASLRIYLRKFNRLFAELKVSIKIYNT